jgi:hypothetical protein
MIHPISEISNTGRTILLIYCLILVSDQGERLRQIASAGSQSQQIARAIEWLKGNYTEPLSIDAAQANGEGVESKYDRSKL